MGLNTRPISNDNSSLSGEKLMNLCSKREDDEINPSKKEHNIISYFWGQWS